MAAPIACGPAKSKPTPNELPLRNNRVPRFERSWLRSFAFLGGPHSPYLAQQERRLNALPP